ncbi:unnamed protein product [Camellia sinensis]
MSRATKVGVRQYRSSVGITNVQELRHASDLQIFITSDEQGQHKPSNFKPLSSSLPPLKCPMAGTFYRSPAPGEPPLVKVGDKVQKGQVLCIIEALKLMNEPTFNSTFFFLINPLSLSLVPFSLSLLKDPPLCPLSNPFLHLLHSTHHIFTDSGDKAYISFIIIIYYPHYYPSLTLYLLIHQYIYIIIFSQTFILFYFIFFSIFLFPQYFNILQLSW